MKLPKPKEGTPEYGAFLRLKSTPDGAVLVKWLQEHRNKIERAFVADSDQQMWAIRQGSVMSLSSLLEHLGEKRN